MAAAKQVKVIREFKKQSSQLDMTMMSESVDETLDKDEAEEETEELTNQLSSAPKGRISKSKMLPPSPPPSSDSAADVDECEKRLASLRRI